jgi:cytochrome c-type biogenesis protein CcmF
MLAEIGLSALFLAFLASVYASFASILGEVRHSEGMVVSGRNAALVSFPLLLVATLTLLIALITEDYQIGYVLSVSSPTTPVFYRITALWGSQKGSLLFWNLLMSLFSFGAILLNWKSDRRLMPYAIAVMMATLAFFTAINIFIESPFTRLWVDAQTGGIIEANLIPANTVSPPVDWLRENAQGLNPLLRHFGMIIHPPMLYLGFVGFVVPFAFAMAALASGDLSSNWIKATRRWTLVAWLFLSLGLILGGRWAYDVLGWGGYWGWDPVENAAFLPWLVGTAFLHSVMIQEKRGMLKVWNMVLVISSFSAVLFGTFATRSGVIESVHSFARSSIGFPMLLFWASMTLIGSLLIVWRWRRGELQDEHEFAGILSRETLFVLNNVIFMALTLAIFWGSFGAPISSELLLGTEITLGKEYFLQVTVPLFVAMYILMGVAPLSAWSANSLFRLGNALVVPLFFSVMTVAVITIFLHGTIASIFGYTIVLLSAYVALYETFRGAAARVKSRGESWPQAFAKLFARNQRRYGGYLVHLGIAVIGIGVIGSSIFQMETRRTLELGKSYQLSADYTLFFSNFESGLAADGRTVYRASLVLGDGQGNPIATIEPRLDQYPEQAMMIAGADSNWERDFYVLLDWFNEEGTAANFVIYINPLVNFVWWGGVILIIGTIAAAWPKDILPENLRSAKRETDQ